jgi:hypothetical protein
MNVFQFFFLIVPATLPSETSAATGWAAVVAVLLEPADGVDESLPLHPLATSASVASAAAAAPLDPAKERVVERVLQRRRADWQRGTAMGSFRVCRGCRWEPCGGPPERVDDARSR